MVDDILDIWAEAYGMKAKKKPNPTDAAEERMFRGTGLLSARQEENTPLMLPNEEASERERIQSIRQNFLDGVYRAAFMDAPKIAVREGRFHPSDFIVWQERRALDMLHQGASLHAVARATYLDLADVARIRRKYYPE